MKSFVKKIKERDNFTCKHCGRSEGEISPIQKQKLTIHHIKQICSHPHLKKDPNNVITLCRECHNKVHAIEKLERHNKNLHAKNIKNRDIERKKSENEKRIRNILKDRVNVSSMIRTLLNNNTKE